MRRLIVLIACGALVPRLSAGEEVEYVTQIKPVLVARCYACHSALRKKSGLRLDTAAALVKGGDSGAAEANIDGLTGLIALDDSTINFYGTDLVATLLDANYQDGAFSLYQVAGLLSDGTPIDGNTMLIQNGTAARYQFLPPPVPEPSSLALIAAASLCVCLTRLRAA